MPRWDSRIAENLKLKAQNQKSKLTGQAGQGKLRVGISDLKFHISENGK
jgi:hypothetical protein